MISMVWDLTVSRRFLWSILVEDDCKYTQFVCIFDQAKLDGFCFDDNRNNDKNVVALQQDAKKIISCSVRIWTEKKLQKLTNKNMAVYYSS